MNTTQLSPTQHATLAYAVHHTGGKVEWLPPNIRAGASAKVIEALFVRGLVDNNGAGWLRTGVCHVTDVGYAAMGGKPAAPAPMAADTETEAAVAAFEATLAQGPAKAEPCPRPNSKQAKIIELLKSPRGANIEQMMLATGWQAHSVRGQMANLKKAGLAIASEKKDGERVYRVG